MISLKIHDHALKHGIAKEDIVHAGGQHCTKVRLWQLALT